ncbi:hypothetical protein D3C72_2504430 [compost metagenome]
MDAVAEQALRSEQAVAGVDVCVVLGFRIEFAGKGDLVAVFRKVRLDVQVGEFVHQ